MEPQSIDRIFWDAAQLGSADERRAYLDRACSGDAGLQWKVEQLLAARASSGPCNPLNESLDTVVTPRRVPAGYTVTGGE